LARPVHINDIDLRPAGIVAVALPRQWLLGLIRDAFIFASRTADATAVDERIRDVSDAVRSGHLEIVPFDANIAGLGITEGCIKDELGKGVRHRLYRSVMPVRREVAEVLEHKVDRRPVQLLGDVVREW